MIALNTRLTNNNNNNNTKPKQIIVLPTIRFVSNILLITYFNQFNIACETQNRKNTKQSRDVTTINWIGIEKSKI